MRETILILISASALVVGETSTSSQNGQLYTTYQEARRICATIDNDGVLVPHRICNMFYKCSLTRPVTFRCPAGTLYDTEKEKCDWADAVDCGSRPISNNNDRSFDENDKPIKRPDSENDVDDDVNVWKPEDPLFICAAADSDGVLVAHENCNQFYKCAHGEPVALTCPRNTLYNPDEQKCYWKNKVDCGDRVIPEQNDGSNDGNDSDNNDSHSSSEENDIIISHPDDAPFICAAENSDGVLVTHNNCNQFYKCAHSRPVALTCPPNTLYNPRKQRCDWSSKVDCGDRVIPEPNDNNNNGDNDNGSDDKSSESEEDIIISHPDDAPFICAVANSDGVLVTHNNCNQFYKCAHGRPVALTCPPNTLYNSRKQRCDWSSKVDCGDRVIPEPNDNASNDSDSSDSNSSSDENDNSVWNCNPEKATAICAKPNSDGVLVAHQNCNQFYKCVHRKPVALTCPRNTLYNPRKERCDWSYKVECGDRIIPEQNDNENEGSDNEDDSNNSDSNENDNHVCNCNPNEAPSICGKSNSEGVLVAHGNCNQFYKCNHGRPVALTCPLNTLYNPWIERCDWSYEVKCGDRVIPEHNDNDNNKSDSEGDNDSDSDENNNSVCNCNPDEAPTICAEVNSDGVLVAHQNCNQFYKCDHSRPVPMTCPLDTLYNPWKERCDWNYEVECGDRVIPEQNDNDGSNSGENDNGSDSNEHGVCNCNPDEAPSICAKASSEGVLIAHENCNQFYKCTHGKPVALTCPANTLYNPWRERCDWSYKVDCGDRMIPEQNDNNGSGNGGNDNESNDNDGSDSSEDNNGECNCNPEEAPSICVKPDSDGVLVAHSNCNQFYKCTHGKPIALTCPRNTLYNPYRERCDWSYKVNCGDRVIPEQNDNDTEGSGVEGDNNECDSEEDDNAACNCNPNEAPSICAAADSDGVLVAHNNCNQFYKCAHGTPVALTCPPHTLYNPYKARCYWENKVECGDRVIPEENDDEDNNSGDTDGDNNSGSDSESNGESNSCNCDPDKAPAICAKPDSDGVFIAHNNCNQFHKCAHGFPVSTRCPSNTLYNPDKEKCEWADKVDCGIRIVPVYAEDSSSDDIDDNFANDNEGNDHNNDSDTENDIDENGGNSDEDNNGNGDENNENDTDNVSDEDDNEYDNNNNSDEDSGVDDNNNNSDEDDTGNDNNNNSDENDGADDNNNNNDENDNGNDNNSNGDNNSIINEVATICAADNSNGVLVAHEICNRFYVCVHNVAIELVCPPKTLYNVYTAECNWAREVNCGDRLLPGDVEGDGDNDSASTDDDDTSIYDDPSQAAAICAASNSANLLIAHENCNQFYQCSGGVAVAMPCSAGLMFNTLTRRCDWPRYVDCGDRINFSSLNKHLMQSRVTFS